VAEPLSRHGDLPRFPVKPRSLVAEKHCSFSETTLIFLHFWACSAAEERLLKISEKSYSFSPEKSTYRV
jgi:hypothetical protein